MNEHIKTFKEWYNSLSSKEKSDFRDVFLAASGLKYPSFYSKLARGVFSRFEQKFITDYAKCEIEFSEKDSVKRLNTNK